MSCAKMAEPIEMQFGMLSQVCPGNVLREDICPHGKGHFWGCLHFWGCRADWQAL